MKEMYYEKVELPSCGILYQNIPPELHIRPMTGVEQDILTTERLVKQGKAVDMVLKNCIKEDINLDELLVGDYAFLLFKLREITYGDEIGLSVRCPKCGADNEITVMISELPLKVYEGSEPVELSLPSKGRVVFRFPRMKDIKASERRAKPIGAEKTRVLAERRITSLLAEILEEFDLPYLQSDIPKTEAVRSMLAKDITAWRRWIEDNSPGIDPVYQLACEECGRESKMSVEVGADFFFPED